MKKYELTEETKVVAGRTLHRIRALVDFGDVKAGDIGGWIEKKNNLSQDGSAWVYDSALVCGEAEVCDSAKVCDSALVCGEAEVCDSAKVCDSAWVYGEAKVYGSAKVYDSALVCGEDTIFWISNIGSRNGTTTFFACKDGKIRVSCGCFYGDLDEFAAKVQEKHGNNEHGKIYKLAIEMAKVKIKIPGEDGKEDK